MRKMVFIRDRVNGKGRLKVLTNFQIPDGLRAAVKDTRGVNYLFSHVISDHRHELELEYAPLVGPSGTEKAIRATVKQYFKNQNQ
jgi:hypothetical protein